MTSKKTYLGVGAFLAVLVIVAVVALTGAPGDGPPDAVSADNGGAELAPVSALERLRSTQPRSDAENAALARARGTLSQGNAIPEELREVTAARLVGTTDGLDIYAVGGPRSLCAVTAPHGSVRGMSVACGRSPEATDGSRPAGGVGKTPDGRQRVFFLFPDDIATVTAHLADGTEQQIPVVDNLVSRTSAEPIETLTWTDAHGAQQKVSTAPEQR